MYACMHVCTYACMYVRMWMERNNEFYVKTLRVSIYLFLRLYLCFYNYIIHITCEPLYAEDDRKPQNTTINQSQTPTGLWTGYG